MASGQVQTNPSKETEEESKPVKDLFPGATEMKETLHKLQEKQEFWQTILTTSWVARFVRNYKKGKKYRLSGPLTKCESGMQLKLWVRRAQTSRLNTDTFHEDLLKLN